MNFQSSPCSPRSLRRTRVCPPASLPPRGSIGLHGSGHRCVQAAPARSWLGPRCWDGTSPAGPAVSSVNKLLHAFGHFSVGVVLLFFFFFDFRNSSLRMLTLSLTCGSRCGKRLLQVSPLFPLSLSCLSIDRGSCCCSRMDRLTSRGPVPWSLSSVRSALNTIPAPSPPHRGEASGPAPLADIGPRLPLICRSPCAPGQADAGGLVQPTPSCPWVRG